MISADDFIGLLEQKDLLPTKLIAHLRKQVARSRTANEKSSSQRPLTAEVLAKWLVEREHLSRPLAQRLLDRAEEMSSELAKSDPADEELGLELLEEDEDRSDLNASLPGLELLDESAPSAQKTTQQKPSPTVEDPAPLGESLFDEQLGPPSTGMGPLDSLDPSELETPSGPLDPLPKKKGLFGARKRKGKRKPTSQRNVWDSPLMLVGGGTLLLFIILAGVFLWAITRQNADEKFDAANEFYRQGSYSSAIKNYDEYLKQFPKHSGVSVARVRRGLSQLRQKTDASNDWPNALKTAKQILPEISGEPEYAGEGRPELAVLLPKIAQGLANLSHEKLDPALIEKTREALALTEKYVTKSLRPVTKLNDIQALLAVTEHQIARGKELENAVAAMGRAREEGNTPKAYEIRNVLLKQYGDLIDDPLLHAAVVEVSLAEQQAVQYVEEHRPPVEQVVNPTKLIVSTMALAERTTESAPPGAENQIVYVRADGAAYGLEGISGKVLWRQPIGFGDTGRSLPFPPTSIGRQPGDDAILVDAADRSVVRIEAASGKILWRHPMGERFDAHPIITGSFLWVATPSGRLVRIDLAKGASDGYFQLPQRLQVAPAIDTARKALYQVAEHSNLYVLESDGSDCRQVVYLGHESGSILAPPVVISRFLILAENNGVDNSILHVLTLEAEGEGPAIQLMGQIPLDGRIDVPPQVSGTRLLVATDLGDMHVFEVSLSNPEEPLIPIASRKVAGEDTLRIDGKTVAVVRFPAFLEDRVWVADTQLTPYDVHASRSRLQPKWIENEKCVTLQPPWQMGESVIHVRREVDAPGVIVSAERPDGGKPFWETRLAVPLASEPILDNSGQLTAITAAGAVFQFDPAEKPSTVDVPVESMSSLGSRTTVVDLLPLSDGQLALVSDRAVKRIPVFDPSGSFRSLSLPDLLGCPPILFDKGVLAPCQSGLAHWLNPLSGDPMAQPFQPRLEAGLKVDWQRAAMVGKNEFVLTDGHRGLYRIGVEDLPEKHLVARASVALNHSIVRPLAVAESYVYAVDTNDNLLGYQLPDLTASPKQPLDGLAVWGPNQVGRNVLVANDTDELFCMGSEGKLVWKTVLPDGPPVGSILQIGSHYLLATLEGTIMWLDATTGNEAATLSVGRPLSTGPVLLDEQILVGGHDGSLLLFPFKPL